MPIIPATLEAEIERIVIQGQTEQKFSKKIPQQMNQLSMVVCVYHSGYTGGISRRIMVPGQPMQNVGAPTWKILKQKGL
jgi:hypothetical protein